MAGAFGYKFLFFSAVFYLFLGFVLAEGAGEWLTTSTDLTYNYTNTTDVENVGWEVVNPFTGIGFLAWLSIAIAIVDGYIIATSLIP